MLHIADESIDPFLDRVYGMNLSDLIEEVSEFGLDMKHCLIIVNEIRNAILDAVSSVIYFIFYKINIE